MKAMTRPLLTVLLAVRAVGGGAVTLAHARDVVSAPATWESRHDARCAVLHDALRCALCHYAGAQVVVQRAVVAPATRPTTCRVPASRRIGVTSDAFDRTAPARAPPTLLS